MNLDFDPFESEEEFVIEESEQLSAIDEGLYQGLVDKVVHEGFSDIDSDVAKNLDTQNNLLDDENEQDGPRAGQDTAAPEPLDMSKSKGSKGSKRKSQSRRRRGASNQSGVKQTKKRKREGTEADFAAL